MKNVLFCFVLSYAIVAQQPSNFRCPPLPAGPYVEFPNECSNLVGDKCHQGCQRGFELIGSCHRVCCPDGNWTGYDAYCIDRSVECPRLSNPFNGRIVGECYNFAGATCKFECNSGWQLNGPQNITCMQSGRWSQEAPTCTQGGPTENPNPPNPLCFDLNPPDFGTIRGECRTAMTPLIMHTRFESGICTKAAVRDICTFMCDAGYTLSGNSDIVCDQPGWRDPAPRCYPILCDNVTAPEHGRIYGECGPGRGGHLCHVECDPGYQPDGPPTIICQADRRWNGEQTIVVTS